MAGDTAAAPAAHQHAPLQAPGAHAALALLFVAPLLVSMPTNANIVLTAALCVYVGCRRSDKPEPPQESMTKEVRAVAAAARGTLSCFLRRSCLPACSASTRRG